MKNMENVYKKVAKILNEGVNEWKLQKYKLKNQTSDKNMKS